MSELILSLARAKRAYRLAVGCLFFLQGLCFASWASRIPTIQQNLNLSDTALGIVLFALPVGSMIALPFAGWLVTRFGSKRIATNALLAYSIFLLGIGLSQNIFILVTSLVFFGMAGNISNIAINTQAVGVEARYGRNIMASFHGLWSLAGFTAAGIGTYMIGEAIIPLYHFVLITMLIIAGLAFSFSFLIPDKKLVLLGMIAFCSMICEGAMFDWSGIYFQKVVGAQKAWIGAGYTSFMCTMAAGRFMADKVVSKIGFTKTIQLSGLLIGIGLSVTVLFPTLLTSIISFLLVGFGV